MTDIDATALDRLYALLKTRRNADPAISYTAQLFAAGAAKIAQKLGEEAVETVIEAVGGDKERLIAESADLLYFLLVLWAARDVAPSEVWRALEARAGKSGIEEKAARPKR